MEELNLMSLEAVSKCRSIRRAIRRGKVTHYGVIAPRKPFNNRGNTCKRKGKHSRENNETKKVIYEQVKHRVAKELSL